MSANKDERYYFRDPNYKAVINFQRAVNDFSASRGLFRGINSLVVAVSGGADSVAMFDWLLTAGPQGLSLIVAHMNHCLRGDESDADEKFVADMARFYDLPFIAKRVDVIKLAKAENRSLEDAGRLARYQFLNSVRESHMADAIAVAHHADDQAETVMHRLIRGSGSSGLSAMRPRSMDGTIVRPFLRMRKKEIESYLRARGVMWREDSSNSDTYYLRNRLRHELMPLLAGINPEITERLCSAAELLADDDAALNEQANGIFAKLAIKVDSVMQLPLAELAKLPNALSSRVFRLAISEVCGSLQKIERSHLHGIQKLICSSCPSGKVSLPGGFVVERSYNLLLFGDIPRIHCQKEVQIDGPGVYDLGGGRIIKVFNGCQPEGPLPASSSSALFTAVLVPFPWRLRYFQAGDRFVPSGMIGHQKVKDYFINRKIPREIRGRIPILESCGRIVWLAGFRIAAEVWDRSLQDAWVAAELVENVSSFLPD